MKIRFLWLALSVFALFFVSAFPSWAAPLQALPDDPRTTPEDRVFMKRAFELALDAVKKGNPPFGALLVQDHKIIFEYENTENTTNDVTKHAETGLISAASPKFSREIRKKCTLYTSTEPCTMCSGAIIWAEFHRVVYGVTETQMERLMPGIPIPKNPLTCKEVMRRSAPQIEVVGPLMEAEGLKAHDGYWTAEMLK